MGDASRDCWFDVDGRCLVRIRGLARHALRDLDRKFDAFGIGDPGREPDLDVAIGPFRPDLAGATHVDHKYFLREGYVCFEEALPGVSFRAEIAGLGTGRTTVRFHAAPGRFGLAGRLYPGLVLHNRVLQPLLELKLGLKGAYLLHGAGVARGGRAAVLAGRGLSYKTTYAFHLVRSGMEFLGDDLLLFDRDSVRPFPVHRRYFDWYVGSGLECETGLRGWRKASMAAHLLGNSPLRFTTAPPSRPAHLTLLHTVSGLGGHAIRDLPREQALAKAWINARMEWSPAKPLKYRIGAFLDAYHVAFPRSPFADHWERGFAALREAFSDAETRLLETDTAWRGGNLSALPALAGGL